MSEGLLLQALREKKSLATSIKASGAHDWDVSQIIKNFLEPLMTDQRRIGIAKSCHADLSRTCKSLIKFLTAKSPPPEDKDVLREDAIQFTIGDTEFVNDIRGGNHVEFQKLVKDNQIRLPCPYSMENGPSVLFVGQGVYDILGWVLSAFGPITSSPPNATPTPAPSSVPAQPSLAPTDYFQSARLNELKRDFLQPLLVLYARWCQTIWSKGPSPKQKDALPTTTELVVRATSRSTIYFALGSSVAGFPHGEASKISSSRKVRMTEAKITFFNTREGSFPHFLLSFSPRQLLDLITNGSSTVNVSLTSNGIASVQTMNIWIQAMTKSKLSKKDVAEVEGWELFWLQSKGANATKDDQAKIAKYSKTTKPTPLSFSGWRDVYNFANRWLDGNTLKAIVDKDVVSGSAYGTCAESYPLLMLTGDAYKNTTEQPVPQNVNPWGFMALPPSRAAELKLAGPDEISKLAMGPCLNCLRLMEMPGVGGGSASFFNDKEAPFVLPWDRVASKVDK